MSRMSVPTATSAATVSRRSVGLSPPKRILPLAIWTPSRWRPTHRATVRTSNCSRGEGRSGAASSTFTTAPPGSYWRLCDRLRVPKDNLPVERRSLRVLSERHVPRWPRRRGSRRSPTVIAPLDCSGSLCAGSPHATPGRRAPATLRWAARCPACSARASSPRQRIRNCPRSER